jgi:hypothetical protein
MVVDVVAAELDRVHERIAGRFGRAEPRARVREYVCGLVAGLERKNGWTLAEHAGEVCPDGMQRLLRRAGWDVLGADRGPGRLEARPLALAAGPPVPIGAREIAYYACYGPRRSTTADLAWIAGSRWHIEECIQQAKGEAGLDHYQVRTWRAWYAHITLSMLALAWLAASKARAEKGGSVPATPA